MPASKRPSFFAEILGIVSCELRFTWARLILKLESHPDDPARLVPWLKTTLRRTPYWMRGHLLFAEHSMQLHDRASAYAGAVTVMASERSADTLKRAAQFTLAKCYLQSGAPETTIRILSALESGAALPVSALEDLSAAYMARNDFARARQILEGVSGEQLSPEGTAARDYLRQKQEG